MILVAGESLVDLIAAPPSVPWGYQAHAGGSPYNVAMALGRLGASVGFVGLFSSDPRGQRLRAHLEASGVDLRHCGMTSLPTTVGFVEPADPADAAGSVRYTFFTRDTAGCGLQSGDVPEIPAGSTDCIHVGSFSLVAEPVASTLETWVGCHPGRCLLSVDPNIRPFLLPDRPEAVERVRRWLGRAHLIKMSEEDLRWMDPEMGVDGACDVYLAGGASLVVVTRGPGGAILANARGRVHVPAAPGPIEDTVGAGDTFQAALLAGLSRMGALDPAALSGLDGDSLRDLGQWAAQAAGVTCSRAGCQPPTSAELDAFPSPRRSGRTPV